MSNRAKREQNVAKRHGGRARPASGAFWGLKRDVRRPGHYLMEHKETSKATYSFKIKDFEYLEKQCTDPLPVYLVEFTTGGAIYILPAWVDAEPRERVETSHLSKALHPTKDLGKKLVFTQRNKEVILVNYTEYVNICKELNVET